jgi:hypothetical protein
MAEAGTVFEVAEDGQAVRLGFAFARQGRRRQDRRQRRRPGADEQGAAADTESLPPLRGRMASGARRESGRMKADLPLSRLGLRPSPTAPACKSDVSDLRIEKVGFRQQPRSVRGGRRLAPRHRAAPALAASASSYHQTVGKDEAP